MNTQTLAEKIIERNFRLRAVDARVLAVAVEGDAFEQFRAGIAWPKQVAHLQKELEALPRPELAALEKEYA